MLKPPADVNDFADHPELRATFDDIWNRPAAEGGRFSGAFVDRVVARSRNYVDLRTEPPTSSPSKIPWNGFPRLISRFFEDESGATAREAAESAADVLNEVLFWVEPDGADLSLQSTLSKDLTFFPQQIRDLARPMREIQSNGSLGADVRQFSRQQDEYLEWHAEFDQNGDLSALVFSAEPPDYWEALAQVSPDLVVERYRAILGRTDIPKSDLFPPRARAAFGVDGQGTPQWFRAVEPGLYDRLNPWTTTRGIVHLTHAANTLGAEINLAGDAAAAWNAPTDNGIPPEIARIACGRYGGINRSSDPLIGKGVGDAIASGARITLTDPIGLYVSGVNLGGLTGPQGEPVGTEAFRVIRGQDDPFEPRIVRFEIRLPPGKPFKLGECLFDGSLLKRGGQIARQTTMHIFAQAYPNSADTTPAACRGKACRHPDRPQHFFLQNIGANCPAAANPRWLFETPQATAPTPVTDSAGFAEIASDAPQGPTTVSDVSVRPLAIPTSRALDVPRD